MAVLGLRCCSRVSWIAAGGGCPLALGVGLLPVGLLLLQSPWAQFFHGTRDRPGPGTELVSPALQGRLFNYWTASEPPTEETSLVRRSPEVNGPTPFSPGIRTLSLSGRC